VLKALDAPFITNCAYYSGRSDCVSAYIVDKCTGGQTNYCFFNVFSPTPNPTLAVGWVSSFDVQDGPAARANPRTYTCLEVCAMLYGGTINNYIVSNSKDYISNTCYYSRVHDNACLVLDGNYRNCDKYNTGGCYSAYVNDASCTSGYTNYCYRVDAQVLPTLRPAALRTYNGYYEVNSGTSAFFAPHTYTCQQACANLHGGNAADYSVSISATTITQTCYYSKYAEGCFVPPENFYNCATYYKTGCYSAYVQDACTDFQTNYCYLTGPSTSGVPAPVLQPTTFVGSFITNSAPGPNSPTTSAYTCQQACALHFGGDAADYYGSASPHQPTRECLYAQYGQGQSCVGLPDAYSKCPYYHSPSCVSAYVNTDCADATNYCFRINSPTVIPTTAKPTMGPSTIPPSTTGPTLQTSVAPTTRKPSVVPSLIPSLSTSVVPTFIPTTIPSLSPSPTICPSVSPSRNPTQAPSVFPSLVPTSLPTQIEGEVTLQNINLSNLTTVEKQLLQDSLRVSIASTANVEPDSVKDLTLSDSTISSAVFTSPDTKLRTQGITSETHNVIVSFTIIEESVKLMNDLQNVQSNCGNDATPNVVLKFQVVLACNGGKDFLSQFQSAIATNIADSELPSSSVQNLVDQADSATFQGVSVIDKSPTFQPTSNPVGVGNSSSSSNDTVVIVVVIVSVIGVLILGFVAYYFTRSNCRSVAVDEKPPTDDKFGMETSKNFKARPAYSYKAVVGPTTDELHL
jgi:hypothetical protein